MNKRFRIPELLGAMLLKPAPPSSTPCFIYYSSVRGAGVKSSRRDVFDPCDDLMRSFRAGFPPLLLLFLFRPDDWAPSAPTVLALFTVWRWGGAGCSRHSPVRESFHPESVCAGFCGEMLSLHVFLLPPWSWTACCFQDDSGGAAWLPPSCTESEKRKKSKGEWKSIPH